MANHVANLRALNINPHVTQNDKHRQSAIDGRTTRHVGNVAIAEAHDRMHIWLGPAARDDAHRFPTSRNSILRCAGNRTTAAGRA
jgi:hypothetical protein